MNRLIELPGSELTKPEIIDMSIRYMLAGYSNYDYGIEGVLITIEYLFRLFIAWIYVWLEIWCDKELEPEYELGCVQCEYDAATSMLSGPFDAYTYILLCFRWELTKPGIYYYTDCC